MARNYSNTAVATTLTAGVNSSTTSVPVASVSGYPDAPFTAILDPGTASEEVVEVTAIVGSAFTATRGVDGTPAQSHGLGVAVVHGVSARDFSEPNQHPGDTTSVHGIANTASLVTLTGAQTLSGKTLTSPTINGGTIASATLTTPTIASFINATHTHGDDASGGLIETGGGGEAFTPAYGAFTGGSQSVSSGGGSGLDQYVTVDTVEYNESLGSLVDSNQAVQITTTGKYVISCAISVNPPVNSVWRLTLWRNSDSICSEQSIGDSVNSFYSHGMALTTDVALTVGDKVRMTVYNVSSATGYSVSDARLTIHRFA